MFVLSALCASASAQEPMAGGHILDLEVGEQITLPETDVKEFSEGVREIVDVRLSKSKKQFVLVGLKPGTTTLLLVLRDGREIRYAITVHPREPSGLIKVRPDIRLDFYFVEVSSNSDFQIGLAWPGTIEGTAELAVQADLLQGGISSAMATITAEALPRIDLAQSKGWARILRHATLVVASGEEGSFSGGGELNYFVEGKTSTGIQTIRFGTDLQIRPRYDARTGRSEIHLSAEVSDLTPSTTTIPGRTVSRVETLVNLELGQAIVLGGLHARSDARTRAGLPVLSQLPVVGALFGSHGGRYQETENVLFIVPTVLEPVTADKRNLVNEALEAFHHFAGEHGPVRRILDRGGSP